jgi:hypothetical protein
VKTANQKRGIVNVSLVKSFVQQVKLKVAMLSSQKKNHQIKLDKSDDQIFQDVLYELIICRPNEFETTLVNDSEILIFSEAKINKVQSIINACKNKIGSLEGQILVKDKKQNIKDLLNKNVNTMMKNPKIQKKVTIHDYGEWQTKST